MLSGGTAACVRKRIDPSPDTTRPTSPSGVSHKRRIMRRRRARAAPAGIASRTRLRTQIAKALGISRATV
jgi:hypothetical protein